MYARLCRPVYVNLSGGSRGASPRLQPPPPMVSPPPKNLDPPVGLFVGLYMAV